MIDTIDRIILNIIREDARISNAELARKLSLAPSAVLQRVNKLETKGVIHDYQTRIDRKAVGYTLTAFVALQVREPLNDGDVVAKLIAIPEVLELHDVAGPHSYFAKVVARDTDHLYDVFRHEFGGIAEITSLTTTLVLKTHKETASAPIAGVEKNG